MLLTALDQKAYHGYLLIFFNMKVYCAFSSESPHRGDSNDYTQYTIFNIKKKIILNYPKSADFSHGSQEFFQNSRSK